MAKRFAYASFGLLCLVAAYQLGVERARADWDMTLSGQVSGALYDHVYDSTGLAWAVNPALGPVTRAPAWDLPVAGTEVKLIASRIMVTRDDELWWYDDITTGTWVSRGPFPGGPVALPAESWGGVKGKYK